MLKEMGFTSGIEIHSGRNRIVRKIFENIITKLDCVIFTGLTKENLPRDYKYAIKASINIQFC